MLKPFTGNPMPFGNYLTEGDAALSYGLGHGATIIGALWGIIWKEFNGAPASTNRFLVAMFFFYLIGLGILIAS